MGVEKRRVPLAGDQPRCHAYRDSPFSMPRFVRAAARSGSELGHPSVDPVMDRADGSRASEAQPLEERPSRVRRWRSCGWSSAPRLGAPFGKAHAGRSRACREPRIRRAPPRAALRAARGDRHGSDGCGRGRAETTASPATARRRAADWRRARPVLPSGKRRSSRNRSMKSRRGPSAATHILTSTPALASAGRSDSRCRSEPPIPLTFCTCRTLMFEQPRLRFQFLSIGAPSRMAANRDAYRCYHVAEPVLISRRTLNRGR